MTRRLILSAALTCTLLFPPFERAHAAGPGAVGQPVILATEENPPASFTDPKTGRLAGVAYEKVRRLMDRAGVSYEVRVLPWKEAYALAQGNPRACVFMANLTEERRRLFKWVAPLMAGGWALYARADWSGKVEDIEDLRGLRIAVQEASAVERHLRRLGSEVGGLRLEPADGHGHLRRLAAREVDLYAVGVWSGWFQARQQGVPVRMVHRLSHSVGGMACHPDFDEVILGRMRAALSELIEDGTARAIDAKYGAPSPWTRGLQN